MISGWITLACPRCPRTMKDRRKWNDPRSAVKMVIICPDCDDGDRHSPTYFDADGHEVLEDCCRPEG